MTLLPCEPPCAIFAVRFAVARWKDLVPVPVPLVTSQTGTIASTFFSLSRAVRTDDALTVPGRPRTLSPTETSWSCELNGFTYRKLSPGGVRLFASVDTSRSPFHVSQPKLPGFVPFRMSGITPPVWTPTSDLALRAIG